MITVTPYEDITYAVTGYTVDGCEEYDTLQIILRRPIQPYNAFSPNGDGINDTWVVENAAAYGDRILVQVFNRWGEPVFESKGYGGSNEWDGTRNGKPMPVGAYYYIITIKDSIYSYLPYKGTVTILR